MDKSLYLTAEQYLSALRRLRERIESGVPLVRTDSAEIGNKFTHCSWGLCSGDKEAWPDAEDHLFPEQFRERGRVAPLYRGHGQMCPLDRSPLREPSGCFFRCRVFHPTEPKMTKELALGLYDKVLERVSQLEALRKECEEELT